MEMAGIERGKANSKSLGKGTPPLFLHSFCPGVWGGFCQHPHFTVEISVVQRGAVLCPGPHSKRAAAQGEDAGVPDSRACVLDCMAPRTELPSPCQGSGAPCLLPCQGDRGADGVCEASRCLCIRDQTGTCRVWAEPRRPLPAPAGPHPQGPKSAAGPEQSSLASLEGSGISGAPSHQSLCTSRRAPLEVYAWVQGLSLHLLEPPASRPLLRMPAAPASAVVLLAPPPPPPGPPLSPLRPVAQGLYLSEPA